SPSARSRRGRCRPPGCGAASAVAGKLALAQYGDTHDVQFLNAYLANEHQDNRRFLADCEVWTGRKITVLRDEKYGADVLNVFRRERYMKGRTGAPCTKLLKRRLLDAWKRPGDVMVLGFTAEEVHRLDDFRERNPDRPVIAPLIERGLGKDDYTLIPWAAYQKAMRAAEAILPRTATQDEVLRARIAALYACDVSKEAADECPDGPRYKAIGNSKAVPVVRWIGKRLLQQLERTA
ncbi:hypothetical protein ACLBU6_16655, partial [Pseudomonas aeruginosa]